MECQLKEESKRAYKLELEKESVDNQLKRE